MLRYTLRQIEYFIAVAESGSFATAAHALNISQPSVSSAVAKLEEAMDIQLLVRHHAQGVSLTSAGGRLLGEFRALLAHADDVRRSAQGLGKNVQGRIHIGCFGPIASLYIPSLLTQFQLEYPQVELLVYEEDIDTLIEGVESNRYDVAIVYKLGIPETLTVEPLIALKPYVILPEQHPLTVRRKVSLKSLAPEPMVLLDLPRSRDYFLSLFESKGLRPTVGVRSPSFESVRALVANGAGYSVLVTQPPNAVCYDGKSVVVRPLLDKVANTEVVLLRPGHVRATHLVNTFVEQCRVHFECFE